MKAVVITCCHCRRSYYTSNPAAVCPGRPPTPCGHPPCPACQRQEGYQP